MPLNFVKWLFGRQDREPVLRIDLIPAPLWRKNLRLGLGKKRWQKLRASLLKSKGDLICETCGQAFEKGTDLNAHERWSYDTSVMPAVAKLGGIGFVCRLCHAAEHFGMTQILDLEGRMSADEVITHYCHVNHCRRRDFNRHRKQAMKRWKRLSQIERWTVDFGAFSAAMDARESAQRQWRKRQERRRSDKNPAEED